MKPWPWRAILAYLSWSERVSHAGMGYDFVIGPYVSVGVVFRGGVTIETGVDSRGLTSHSIYVYRVEVQLGHLLKEVAARGTRSHSHSDGLRQPLSLLCRHQEGIHRRRGVEVRDALLLEELPYQRVVDLSQADVEAANRYDGPRERPSDGVEPWVGGQFWFISPRLRGETCQGGKLTWEGSRDIYNDRR